MVEKSTPLMSIFHDQTDDYFSLKYIIMNEIIIHWVHTDFLRSTLKK